MKLDKSLLEKLVEEMNEMMSANLKGRMAKKKAGKGPKAVSVEVVSLTKPGKGEDGKLDND